MSDVSDEFDSSSETRSKQHKKARREERKAKKEEGKLGYIIECGDKYLSNQKGLVGEEGQKRRGKAWTHRTNLFLGIVRLEWDNNVALAGVKDASMMRYLIKQYVPIGTTLHDLKDWPCYNLESQFKDEELQRIFYKDLFHPATFIMKDGKWFPNYKHILPVEDVLGPGMKESLHH